jgi:hypothetical protein
MDKAARLESVDNDPTVINEEEGMKGITKGVLGLVLASFIAGLAMGSAIAQDPTVVDAKHYKVMFENEQVRVLKITYGPKEKSVMHEHPNGITLRSTSVSLGLRVWKHLRRQRDATPGGSSHQSVQLGAAIPPAGTPWPSFPHPPSRRHRPAWRYGATLLSA